MPKRTEKSSTIWQIPEIGNVLLSRNRNAKRLTISIRPTKGVRVTIPGYLPLTTAKLFVEQKRGWIIDKLNEISSKESLKAISSGYKTRYHTLNLIACNSKNINVKIESEIVNFYYPQDYSSTSTEVQSALKNTIEQVFRLEAKKYLPSRVDELTKQHSFNFNALRIKNITSRWGSCSSLNNINLSIYLMKLPDELIDYVILHELTHTIHKNHGPNFWSHLNRITGNAKGLSARVKKYKTGV
jgi:predicted metal-dependent hydrolase